MIVKEGDTYIAARIGCSSFFHHITVTRAHNGKMNASAIPIRKRHAANPPKFWAAAVHIMRAPQQKDVTANTRATGSFCKMYPAGYSKIK